ncbi:sensor histidine kinase [Sphingomonas koreensis]|uniref:sensor histidine kinase n=1 Tax=Sphingomonas koreensis TaxID=93064 RepID=UPI00082E77D1|nr:HAMP domain-containing sensor histidine kinase [Sphingomonas koreensis]PJI87629.1 signal transduction histidine kinase [Sphingomonas koreensis]
MRRIPLWPRSMMGQMALVVAAALFLAQALNFGLALRDRSSFRLAQATRPVAIRVADALEREVQNGRPIPQDRGRVRRAPGNPIPPYLERRTEVQDELRRQLTEQGVTAGRIDTGVRQVSDEPLPMEEGRRPRGRRPGPILVIAIEVPGKGWLTTAAPWERFPRRLFWLLAAQTLILYAIMLLPVLWATRRISRPLHVLAAAARRFQPGVEAEPVAEAGPSDVRAVISAYNALSRRVTAMLDEKDQMLGAIGHDLRTPLAALRVRIESVDDEEDRARMADTIDEMNRTLDDILSLARLGRPSEAPTETDLSALIDAVVDDFRELGHAVDYQDGQRLIVRLRPALMRRAVRNLIENAVKYGGGRSEVLLTADPAQVRIEVADRGPGIPADQLAAVFDPFTRLDPSRNRTTGGVGLGLTLARAIVREAGGDIALANREGGGLSATIALPRR